MWFLGASIILEWSPRKKKWQNFPEPDVSTQRKEGIEQRQKVGM